MNKFIATILAILCGAISTQALSARPNLDETKLFREIVTNCKDVDLKSWEHPVKSYLNNKDGAELLWVKLCNSGKYPVLGVNFRYAPGGQTEDYFTPLYFATLEANDNLPYSFVVMLDQTVINLALKKVKGKEPVLSESHEYFSN